MSVQSLYNWYNSKLSHSIIIFLPESAYMTLKQIETLLKDSSPEYWSTVGEMQVQKMLKTVNSSWMARYQNYLEALVFVFGVISGITYYALYAHSQWQVGFLSAIGGLVLSFLVGICGVLFALMILFFVMDLTGYYRACNKALQPVDRSEGAGDSKRIDFLSTCPEVHSYIEAVSKTGRKLLDIDLYIMADIYYNNQYKSKQQPMPTA